MTDTRLIGCGVRRQITRQLFESRQLVEQYPQIDDLLSRLVDLATQQSTHEHTRSRVGITGGDDLADLIQTEPQAAGLLDEAEAVSVGVVVEPVTGRRPGGYRQHPFGLIEADRRRVNTYELGKLTDPELNHLPARIRAAAG